MNAKKEMLVTPKNKVELTEEQAQVKESIQ